MATYFTLLTPAGLAKVANAQLTNEKIEISQVAVGDANGTPYQPLGTETVLKNEVWRGSIASIEIDSQNPNWIVVEGVIPASAGGFTIREVGLFDVDGTMIAIGNYPDTYKPVIADGSTMDLALRTIIEVSNAASVTLRVDPNVIVASRAYVDNRLGGFNSHLADDELIKHKASQISVLNPDTQSTQNMQSFAETLFTSVSNGKQVIGTAITDVDNSLVVPQNPTFQNLAELIGNINTGRKVATLNIFSSSTRINFKNYENSDILQPYVTVDTSTLDFEPSMIIFNYRSMAQPLVHIWYGYDFYYVNQNNRGNHFLDDSPNIYRVPFVNGIMNIPVGFQNQELVLYFIQ